MYFEIASTFLFPKIENGQLAVLTKSTQLIVSTQNRVNLSFLVIAGLEAELWDLLLALVRLGKVEDVEVLVAQILELELETAPLDS